MTQTYNDRLPIPEFGEPVAPAHPSTEMLEMLARRRSTTVATMAAPGPDEDTLNAILTIAARVPDHRRLVPFRFITFTGEARTAFGNCLAAAATAQQERGVDDAADPAMARGLFERAPVVVAVISKVDRAHRTPEWEQILTAGAVCQNLLLAASALGFAGQWLSGWAAYDEAVLAAMGLGNAERVAGLMYLGTAQEEPRERARPDVPSLITRWTTPA